MRQLLEAYGEIRFNNNHTACRIDLKAAFGFEVEFAPVSILILKKEKNSIGMEGVTK